MKNNIIDVEKYTEQTEEVLQTLQKDYAEPQMSEEQFSRLRMRMEEAKRENRRDRKRAQWKRTAATAAAIVISFVVLPNTSPVIAHAMEQIPVLGQLVKVVTFRDYEYSDEQHEADVEVPELVVESQEGDSPLQENLGKSVDEINAEIQEISTELLSDFMENMRDEKGYKELVVKSEVIATTKDYFTLKISCYEGTASGYEWDYFYTINLNTGNRIQIADIFAEGSDYISVINNNIMEQMEEQMSADENVRYWLHDEMEEFNFKTITEETSFYINSNNNVVICFNEGEVAPMYMGTVEFEIPAEVLNDIRR